MTEVIEPLDESACLMVVTEASLRAAVANWAVRQSPYDQGPEGLGAVLAEVTRRFRQLPEVETVIGTCMWTVPLGPPKSRRAALLAMLEGVLLSQPQVLAWNKRKNGREGMGVVSRYDLPGDPDDDFIDLDALARNIVSSLVQENDNYLYGKSPTRNDLVLCQRRARELWQLLEETDVLLRTRMQQIWNRDEEP